MAYREFPVDIFHGFLGRVAGIIVTPIAHWYFFPRIMLDEDGTIKDKGMLEEELEKMRKS